MEAQPGGKRERRWSKGDTGRCWVPGSCLLRVEPGHTQCRLRDLSALCLSVLIYKKEIVFMTPMRVVVKLVIRVNTCTVLSTSLSTD